MPLVLIKDFVGYRVATYENYNGAFFKLEDGSIVGKTEACIADAFNVEHCLAGRKPMTPEEMMYMPLEPEAFLQLLGNHGYGISDEMRVRPKLGEPLTRLNKKNAVLAIMAHVKVCQDMGHNPEATPMLIAMHPETKEIALMVPTKTPGEMGICPIPDEVPDINEEAEMGTINQGRQVCFKWHDWALVPQTSVSAKLYQFLDVQTIEATSFTELEKTFLISDEGIITKSGANQLLFKGISIDDFLKGV